jgi:hypothetical protein
MIANIISIMFNHLLESDVHKIHAYDSISSSIFLILKVIVAMVFVLGIIRSYLSSASNLKSQNFLKKFGPLGFLYLISQPLLVLIIITISNA